MFDQECATEPAPYAGRHRKSGMPGRDTLRRAYLQRLRAALPSSEEMKADHRDLPVAGMRAGSSSLR
jgi:hypothetical protein